MAGLPLLLVADLLIENVGVDFQHLAGGVATAASAQLEDAQSVSLKLPDSWWDVGAVTAPLLLRAPEDGTAEPSGVNGGLGGPARSLQHLVPVCAVTTRGPVPRARRARSS